MNVSRPMFVLIMLTAGAGWAQSGQGSDADSVRLGKSQTQSWRLGAIAAQDSASRGVVASAPFPTNWPEQVTRVLQEEVSAGAKLAYKTLPGGGAKQFVLTIPSLAAKQQRQAVITVEVLRYEILPPADTGGYTLPDTRLLTPEIRACLQASRHIESDHPRIRSLAQDITSSRDSAWQQVEAIYDWVRSNIKNRPSMDLGALKAIENGHGDGVELSSAFVAICRAGGIPARLVWVPLHCYPEFYLQDAAGQGRWFPCRTAGKREFGGIAEFRPILSKGDKFPIPDRPRDTERFVAEHLIGFGSQPDVRFLRELAK